MHEKSNIIETQPLNMQLHAIFLQLGRSCEIGVGVGVGWLVDAWCCEVDWEDVSVLVELVSVGVRR